jgi:pimeloyl-ACP methyl ester carboxylesterase
MRRLALLTLLLGLAPAAAHAVTLPAPEETVFRPCGTQSFARCGRVMVPLDRPAATAAIGLSVRRAAIPGLRRGTVFALAGGPGQAATPFAEGTAFAFRRALQGREVVTFDQRGIGGSGLIRCPTLEATGEQTLHVAGAAADCADRLGPRRAFYTTRDSVEDLETVRRAVHAERVTLYGTSYGTKLALAYAAAYPQRVERLVLDSVVAANGPDPFIRDSLQEVPRILRQRCSSGCARFTRDPAADLAALVTSIARGGLMRGPLVRRDGRPHPARLGRIGLIDLLFAGDFDPTLRAGMPAAVRSALNGDPAPLLRLAHRGSAEFSEPVVYFNPAIFAATVCEEGPLPFTRTSPPADRLREARAHFDSTPDAALGGFDRNAAFFASGTFELCRLWPSAPSEPAIAKGPFPAVPALVLSGEDDLRTPLATAAAVAKQLPRATLLSVPDAGHSVLDWPNAGCARRALRDFLASRSIKPCRRGRRVVPLEPIAPTSPSQLAPIGGVPGHPGRTLAAVKRTLEDAGAQFDANFFSPLGAGSALPGLRGGRFTLKSFGFDLQRLEYVPGVRLSGELRGQFFSSGQLRVFGPAASPGRLRARHGVLSGRLGGRRVSLRIPPELPRIEQHSVRVEFDVGEGRRRSPVGAGSTPVPPSAGRR